jgi:hypothetical protein
MNNTRLDSRRLFPPTVWLAKLVSLATPGYIRCCMATIRELQRQTAHRCDRLSYLYSYMLISCSKHIFALNLEGFVMY